MVSLKELLKNIVPIDNLPEISIKGLTLDSRSVKAGDLFFAYPGVNVDRRQFIDSAIANGAVAVLQEKTASGELLSSGQDVPLISIENLVRKVSGIASQFYGNPSHHMNMVAVTGTNGKTSCCHLLAEAIGLLEHQENGLDKNKIGIMGTVGNGVLGKLSDPGLTTSDPISVQKFLKEMHIQQVPAVVMEASSHALEQGRISGIEFKLGIFTNLTHEHLDYHRTMDAYAKSKRRLFEMPKLRYGVFNLDDPVGAQWLKDFRGKLNVCGYSLNAEVRGDFPLVVAKSISLRTDGFSVVVSTSWGEVTLQSRLLGRFNVSNLLAVVSALCCLGYEIEDVAEVVKELHPVAGRMQTFGGNKQPLVVVDFAHTPDALYQSLSSLRQHCSGKLFCVFGCGGDRDATKRPKMAKVSEQFADCIVVTDDNVRTENPDQIFKDILSGFCNVERVRQEHDRAKAIRRAIDLATRGDIVLIAGKGHEEIQIIGAERTPFSDINIVQAALKKREDKK